MNIASEIQFQFEPALVRDLLDRFEKADFFVMTHRHNYGITDIPSELITLRACGRSRTFENRWSGNMSGITDDDFQFHSQWSDLAQLIDDGVQVEQWIGTKQERSNRWSKTWHRSVREYFEKHPN